MSVSSEAKRTLVKSPPELWAELSDAASLARHLGELGEIRIVRTDPERAVEWEAADISGTVLIEPSGWGTKVTLTAVSAEPGPPPRDAPRDAAADTKDAAADTGDAAGASLDPTPESIAECEPEPAHEPEPARNPELAHGREPGHRRELAEQPEPEQETEPALDAEPGRDAERGRDTEPALGAEPRRGFFARLFGRHRHESQTSGERAPSSPQPTFQAPLTAISMGEIAPRAGATGAPPTEMAAAAAAHAETPDAEAPGSDIPEPPRGEPQAADVDTVDVASARKPPFDWEPMIAREHALETGAGDQAETIDAHSPPESPEAIELASSLEGAAPLQPPAAEGSCSAEVSCSEEGGPSSAEESRSDVPRSQPSRSQPSRWQPSRWEESQDISAELASLEERTTAVLVGVLDRLGAAHHRPFSRG
jgi:hypothetical protein